MIDENDGLNSRRKSAVSNTSRTERNSMRNSPRIIQETDCGWSSKFFDNKNLYMSPNSHHDQHMGQNVMYQTRVASGSGMRTLPRLSASQAVNNFREIYSEKDGGAVNGHHNGNGHQTKYRHVSHIDFHKSQEMIKKQRKGTAGDDGGMSIGNKLIASSDGLGLGSNDPGFSSITPVGVASDRRKL